MPAAKRRGSNSPWRAARVVRLASGVDSFIPLALVLGGVALVAMGLMSRFGSPGRLPGDLRARRGPVTFYAPLGTSLLLSVILTVVLNLAFCASPR